MTPIQVNGVTLLAVEVAVKSTAFKIERGFVLSYHIKGSEKDVFIQPLIKGNWQLIGRANEHPEYTEAVKAHNLNPDGILLLKLLK